MSYLVVMWRMMMRGWWWAAPLAFLASWGLPEAGARALNTAETPLVRTARAACFLAAGALLLLLDRRRRRLSLRFIFDPDADAVTRIPWTDRFLAVTLAQWAWLALPLCGWALVRVVG
jgi:hypothetical protein